MNRSRRKEARERIAKLLRLSETAWARGKGYWVNSDRKGKRYKPSPSQQKFHTSGARFKALVGGRGSGKSTAGAHEALVRISGGNNGLVLSPDFEHFKISTWPEFRAWIPWHHVAPEHQRYQEKTWVPSGPFLISFDTGAVVYCKGLKDPDSARGPNVNWFWYDEGGRDKTGAGFDIAIGGVRIGPSPTAFVTTTPAGRRHWLYRKFVLQEIAPQVNDLLEEMGFTGKLYEYFHATIHDNKANLDPLFYASMLQSYQGKFAEQELLGLFTDLGSGLVYWNFGPENIDAEAEFSFDRGPVEIAYDDGFASNPRVFLFLQRGEDGVITIFDELYHTQHLGRECVREAKGILRGHIRRVLGRALEYEAESYEDALERAKGAAPELAERAERLSHIEIAVGDPSAAELRGAFRIEDIPARGGPNAVIEGINKTLGFIKRPDGLVRVKIHPRCKNLIYEFTEGYTFPEGSENSSRDVAPLKQHDHGPDALRYWIALRGGKVA